MRSFARVSFRIASLLASFAVVLAIVLSTRGARADAATCDGPTECCPEHAQRPTTRVTISIGIVVLGISEINERSGTWDADYYLYESWAPSPGLFPQTEIVNEVERKSAQFDSMVVRDGRCIRSRRIHSTLRNEYNLHAFPFDEQTLSFEVSDDEYTAGELVYADGPFTLGIDDALRTTVSGWRVATEPTFSRESRAFKWEAGAPAYDYGKVAFGVRRHVTFHLAKYFLPLFVIVALAFSAFWISPEDLGSQLTIGITCLLAAIAFQFAEAGSLPEVAYLTFADRVYVVSYVAIGLAVVESIYTNALFRRGDKERAARVDRWCRVAFPVVLVVALVGSALRAFAG
jgi:hypothetical protein